MIIAGRGGGSFEDLLAFNDESVVRAYADSRIPIVSAVGHEIDHPLSDLAADAFAPTPSAAAEETVPVYEDLAGHLEDYSLRLHISLKNRHRQEKDRLMRLFESRVYREPQSIFEPFQQSLDLCSRELRQATFNRIREGRLQLSDSTALQALYERNLMAHGKRFSLASERLQNFSPLATLKRGYSVVRDFNGNVLRDSAQSAPGD